MLTLSSWFTPVLNLRLSRKPSWSRLFPPIVHPSTTIAHESKRLPLIILILFSPVAETDYPRGSTSFSASYRFNFLSSPLIFHLGRLICPYYYQTLFSPHYVSFGAPTGLSLVVKIRQWSIGSSLLVLFL